VTVARLNSSQGSERNESFGRLLRQYKASGKFVGAVMVCELSTDKSTMYDAVLRSSGGGEGSLETIETELAF